MQGTSYAADQPVGEVAFTSGFYVSHFAVDRDVDLNEKKKNNKQTPQESYGYDRLPAWNEKRMIVGKRLPASFLIPPPT